MLAFCEAIMISIQLHTDSQNLSIRTHIRIKIRALTLSGDAVCTLSAGMYCGYGIGRLPEGQYRRKLKSAAELRDKTYLAAAGSVTQQHSSLPVLQLGHLRKKS